MHQTEALGEFRCSVRRDSFIKALSWKKDELSFHHLTQVTGKVRGLQRGFE